MLGHNMSKSTKKPRLVPAPNMRDAGPKIKDVSGHARVTQIGRDQIMIKPQVINLSRDSIREALREALRTERIWNIPPPIRSFVGREGDLANIETTLARGGAAALAPAITLHGTGGVGKTQLALAYAERHGAEYRLGWSIAADTELEITTGLARLAEKLGLDGDPPELAAAVVDALRAEDSWLLIFDNATPKVLSPFLPRTGRGQIVITSRNPAWPGIATGLRVEVFPLEVSIDLLLNRSGQTDRQAATELAKELGCLPLALEQAASYMTGPPSLEMSAYMELFRQRRDELLEDGVALDYEGTVGSTFSLAVDRIAEFDENAIALLRIFAFLAPETIPVGLVSERVGSDPLELRKLLVHLSEAGLLTAETARTMRMHRLVQAVVRIHLTGEERQASLAAAIELLIELMPGFRDPADWPTAMLLLPHVQIALDHARAEGTATDEVISLSMSFGSFALVRGLRPELATGLFSLALDITRRLHPDDDRNIGAILGNLANAMRAKGDTKRARELSEQTLASFRRQFPDDNVDVAQNLSNLAVDYTAFGDHQRARDLDEEALAMFRRLFPGDHRDVATSLNNLAADVAALGQVERALELDEEALAMRRRLFPGDHPNLATSLHNLANDLIASGQAGRALELDEEALAMRRRLFPGDHPDVVLSLNHLAADLRRAGETLRAESLDEDASAMRRRLTTSRST
jgi:tetratricopeptide (TPR) repeat protein